jgi:MoaA/NifB/PqqE/SkfB family radical SAM enzyme
MISSGPLGFTRHAREVPVSSTQPFFTIDIELTNRCNAKCYFCPRDQTPHQGLMSEEVFDQALARAVEFRDAAQDLNGEEVRVSLCGLGEPLLNPRAADAVRKVKAAGFECVMASNGSILDERKGRALLDAGLDAININVGDHDDDYERIYELPFERTLENVVRFNEMAGEACTVSIVLVDHRRDRAHIDNMMQYWRDHGLEHFVRFDIMNRGGALFVDDMQFESSPHLLDAHRLLQDQGGYALCGVPFRFMFIGYDGNYYLCCSDWKKEAPLGTVFDFPLNAVVGAKFDHVKSREPICKTCNWDPLNMVVDELHAVDDGDSDLETVGKLVDDMVMKTRLLEDGVMQIEQVTTPSRRRLIPVRSA